MAGYQSLTMKGFGLRFLFALLLVLATYNPSGYSYAQWVIHSFSPLKITPYIAICGIFLAIGWAIYIRATLRSLGIIGLTLAIILFSCFVWLFIDLGWLNTTNVTVLSWIVLLILALTLAIGMSWSHIRRRLSGQVDTDDIDND